MPYTPNQPVYDDAYPYPVTPPPDAYVEEDAPYEEAPYGEPYPTEDAAYPVDAYVPAGGTAPTWGDDTPMEEDDLDSADYLDEQEAKEARELRFRMLSGFMNFAGVIVGMVVILLMIALIISMVNWLRADLHQSFVLLGR